MENKNRLLITIVIGMFLVVIMNVVSAAGIEPVPIGSITSDTGDNSLDFAYDVVVADGYAYTVSRTDDTLVVWNVSNSSQKVNPEQVGFVQAFGPTYSLDNVYNIAYEDNFIYAVSSADNTFSIYNVTNKSNPTGVGYVSNLDGNFSLDDPKAIAVSNGYAYIMAQDDFTFTVWNVTNDSQKVNPDPVGHYNETSAVYLNTISNIFIKDGLAYTTASSGSTLAIWNVTDPSLNPELLSYITDAGGSINLGQANEVYVTNDTDDTYAYVITGGGDLIVYNVTDPTITPVEWKSYTSTVGDYSIAGGNSIEADSDFLYIGSSTADSIVKFDITDKSVAPNPIGSYSDSDGDYSLDGTNGQFLDGDYLYTVSSADDTFAIFDIAGSLSVIIDSPTGTYSYFNNIPLNLTIANFTTLNNCIYEVRYSDIPGVLISNTSIADCGNITFDLFAGDNDFNVTVWVNDSLGNMVSAISQFNIRTTSPSVILNAPSDNTYFNNGTEIYFNFTATDTSENLDTCQLWGDFNGTWHNNYTWTSPSNGVMNYTNINLTDGSYEWNVWCNDTLGNSDWGVNNFTTTIDTIFPIIVIDSILTTSGSQTINFNHTITDTNTYTCKYSVFNSTSGIDGIYENITINCNNGLVSATVSAFGTYNLTLYSTDRAGNENSTTSNFTTIAGSSPPPTGGSSTEITVIGANSTWSIKTETGGDLFDFIMSLGSTRSKAVVFTNLGEYEITLNISCDDVNLKLCKYITLSDTMITLKPGEIKSTSFTLTLPDDEGYIDGIVEQSFVDAGKYDINIVAMNLADDSQSVVSIRVRIGSYSVFSWIAQKITGKTNIPFGEDGLDMYNFFLIIMPFIILAPLLFFFILANNSIKFPLSLMITFFVSIAVIIFI